MSEPASSLISRVLEAHFSLREGMASIVPDIERAGAMLAGALESGGTLYLCGNGGSAADAQHIATELVGRFLKERRALPAVALHTNTSTLTAVGNDYGFEDVYARQVEAFCRPGDVLIGISTSGNSESILKALRKAREMGVATLGLTGRKGGRLPEACDQCLHAPSDETPRIQEMHILIGHILCQICEDALCSDKPSS